MCGPHYGKKFPKKSASFVRRPEVPAPDPHFEVQRAPDAGAGLGWGVLLPGSPAAHLWKSKSVPLVLGKQLPCPKRGCPSVSPTPTAGARRQPAHACSAPCCEGGRRKSSPGAGPLARLRPRGYCHCEGKRAACGLFPTTMTRAGASHL